MGDLIEFYQFQQAKQRQLNQRKIMNRSWDDIEWQDFEGKDVFPPGPFYQALMAESAPWIAGIFGGLLLTPLFMMAILSL